MDLDTLSMLVIEKFRGSGGYSELDDKKLFKSIRECLDLVYNQYMHAAKKRIEDEERRGIFPNKQQYEKEYSAVEDRVMDYANRLAAVKADEV